MKEKSKNALITGSTSGIGLGIAYFLAERGFNLVINGLGDEETIKDIVTNIKDDYQVEVLYHSANLLFHDEINSMIDFALDRFTNIDLLVNNAGIQHVAPVEDFSYANWQKILDINLSSAFCTISRVLPSMKKNNYGRIVNIASAHGVVASKNKSGYVAAKHGIVGLTKTVALEVCEHNITCNSISPGWVLTELVKQQINKISIDNNISYEQAEVDLLSTKHPNKKFVEIEEIAEAILFVYNNGGSINGSNLIIDGCWTAQ